MRQLLSLLIFTAAAWGQTDGWIDLFPDPGFAHWKRFAMPPTAPPKEPTQWKVDTANRILVCEGNNGHEMLLYDREFADFTMHVEWRFTKVDGEPRYNSGIFVRTIDSGNIWHQAQTGQTGGYLFGTTPVNGIKQRINLREQMKENRVKPVGEWNAYEVTCKGRTISLAVNGATVSEFTQCEVPRGYVGLEAEGFRIEFRNIRVKPL